MSSEGDRTESAGGAAELAAALRGKRALLVASTGGHLAQIVRWSERFGLRPDSVFATFDSEQSRSLLRGRDVVTLDYVPPRGLKPAFRAAVRLHRETRRERFDVVLSTGAAVGISAYAIGQLRRLPVVYIESVSRFDGPSATGRILEKLPRIQRYSQHAGWADRPGWRLGPSLLDDYTAVPAPDRAPRGEDGRRVFVSLGTIKPFRFDALVDAVRKQLRPGDTVTWQLGVTTRDDLPGNVNQELRAEEFDRLLTDSDVFVTHSGVGTLLRALELGVRPVVVPRLAARGEHVDDHQLQVARELAGRGLVALRSPDELASEDLDPADVVIRRSGDTSA
ncbi:glycosyltransferase [Blastococcus sp. VKM Ac-2987]|uniref:glycosyltransferase n=1 Tax=Blastococcus sp. VKM Ac-2987 TaxID=3004141 RepID=UPI0022ABB248|nr:glycosyltransferase [Blastococcus sp. VKM Ac-2987]MCZ2858461.1 glycosyltransferase [Blastococcus sp. VKM Ac-2987]